MDAEAATHLHKRGGQRASRADHKGSASQLYRALKTDMIAGAAKALLKLVSVVSGHSIFESVELAAERVQLAHQRSTPFMVAVAAQIDQG